MMAMMMLVAHPVTIENLSCFLSWNCRLASAPTWLMNEIVYGEFLPTPGRLSSLTAARKFCSTVLEREKRDRRG
jgi:hypothetical protein